MYTTKTNEKNVSNEQHQLNLWQQHRQQYRRESSINFSDIVEDQTIYDQTNSDMTYASGDISDRASSAWGNEFGAQHHDLNSDKLSVDDILQKSFIHEIRNISQQRAGTLSTSIRSNMAFEFSASQFPPQSDNISCVSADFRPAEEMHDQLNKDEKEWEQEFADIPQMNGVSMSMSMSSSVSDEKFAKPHGKLTNMTDFSVAYLGETTIQKDLSIGRFFQNRCQDLTEMIPAKSPKKHTPIALVSNSMQSASSSFTDDESSTVTNTAPRISSATYDKERSVISLSTIKHHLENDAETPQSFLDKLYPNKSKLSPTPNVISKEKSQSPQAKMVSKQQNQDYREYNQHEYVDKDAGDMLNRMNSTKIEEQNDEHMTNANCSTDTEVIDGDKEYLEVPTNRFVLGSNCSPIKNRSPPRPIENSMNTGKRAHRKVSPLTNEEIMQMPVENRFEQKENVQHVYNNNNKSHHSSQRMRSPEKNPLDDVSSLMLNKLRINSPEKRPKSPVLVRKCSTDLNPTIQKSIENRLMEEQRHYAMPMNRSSPDRMKMSLPNYGLHGLRSSYQDAISLEKRCNSQMSTHSEFTQHDGKFPLKSNTSELVWECIKLRKSVTKTFVIKNTSEKKLSLKMNVVGPGFQIASGTDVDSVALQGNECRTIAITFCPTVIGKAIGRVIFKPTKHWPEETERAVNLWAYGGSTVLQLQGVERGPVGSSFLKMGETNSITSTILKRSFSIYNKGPLNGIATIFVKPKTNQCINDTHISIEPNKCAIQRDCSTTITVSYKLRRKDLERLREKSCEVLTVGTLEVIFGSEPNRQRIETMLTRNGDIPATYKQLEFLVYRFPVAGIECFTDFCEHIDNVSDLFGCFKTSEIALTINRTNLDETGDGDLSGMEDSVLFKTLIETPNQYNSSLQPKQKNDDGKMWSIHPKRLLMDTRNNTRKALTIQSYFQQPQTFQIDSDYRDYFHFSTRSGQIKPGTEYKIDIELRQDLHITPFNGVIAIYIETDCIEVPINVQPMPRY
ncbi:uncharacterized protein LOC116338772 isoform X2 [Contarinia nasturtii]|uniref:uncharacterized protein LOC116338772 isoform X2 n=1 Tax=Contarinia nasturtii TaxID=265458 RepID=UPI0012D3A28B|nr:uncharacterized protein LOC116338772 isoform X2 [Contarinia nasturtii]